MVTDNRCFIQYVDVKIYTRLFSKIVSEVSVARSQRATEEVHSSLIAAANKDVLDILEKPVASKKKGSYIKITPEEKAKIARYAIENGNCAAARKFSKHGDLDKTLGESTVRSWVAIYKKELERKRRMGETVPEITVLPQAKRGRPLLVGEKLDSAVKAYVRSVREAGGIVTSSIVAAAATAMVRKEVACREWWPLIYNNELG